MNVTSAVEPSWPERARTVVADARVATLSTGCRRRPPTVTSVAVEDRGDGIPVLWLAEAAPAIGELASCRVATLVLRDPGSVWSLRMVGSFLMQHPDVSGIRTYTPTLLSVRAIGPAQVTIPVDAFLRAEPDPLREHAAAVLAHLRAEHSDDLLACARAHGHDADIAVPRALDRYGIELSLLGADGCSRLRLDFPGGPVNRLEDIETGLRVPLVCACGRPAGEV